MKPIQMTYPTTGVEETTLRLIGEKFSSTPENYKIHGGKENNKSIMGGLFCIWKV